MPRGSAPEPRYHDRVNIPFPGWGAGMRVVMTDEGPLGSLQSYMLSLGTPSPTMQRNLCTAVGRLYDYYRAAPPQHPRDSAEFLGRFAKAVLRGTIADGADPLDLYWPPTSQRKARQIVRFVTTFGDFCAEATGTGPLNPTRDATFAERIVEYRRLAHRRKYDLLAHLGTPEELKRRAQVAREVAIPRGSPVLVRQPPFFPFEHTSALMTEGFRVRASGRAWEQYNLGGLLIAILQRFGGVRASETLHLFVRDVTPVHADRRDPTKGASARVLLFHPADGVTPYVDPLTGRRIDGATRAAFLQAQYGRVPRHDERAPAGQRVGWKGMLIEDAALQCSTVHWFPEEWGVRFWELYDLYVRHVRPRGLDAHPYLFVATHTGRTREGESYYGNPLSLGAYADSLEGAVGRIGLQSGKELGTTSHGLRHAYAQTLRLLGVSRKLVQLMLHHGSPLSQDVYTQPAPSEIGAALRDASANFRAGRLPEGAPVALRDPSLLLPAT